MPGRAFDHESKSQGADGEVNAGQPDEDLGDEPRHECGKDNAQRNRNKADTPNFSMIPEA
jgi:hypothetical protein